MPTPLPEPGPGETLDRLAGEWWIFQLRQGQRYSTDDVLTAWTAVNAQPQARRVLELGAGTGALGLMALLRLPGDARLTTIEVQEVSVALQRRTVRLNGLAERVDVRQGDLRAADVLEDAEHFDLVVANPPYLPRGSALESPHAARRAARLELHGDIFDFCRRASRHLAPEGRFCFSFAAGDPRPASALAEAGLHLLARRDVVFRAGGAPVIALYTAGRGGERREVPALTTREADGRRTEALRRVRVEMLIEAP